MNKFTLCFFLPEAFRLGRLHGYTFTWLTNRVSIGQVSHTRLCLGLSYNNESQSECFVVEATFL